MRLLILNLSFHNFITNMLSITPPSSQEIPSWFHVSFAPAVLYLTGYLSVSEEFIVLSKDTCL